MGDTTKRTRESRQESVNRRDDNGAAVLRAFQKYRPRLTSLVARFVRPGDVEDIVQETFLRTFVVAKRRGIKHPKAYMDQTARHLAINFIALKDNKSTGSIEDIRSLDVYLDADDPGNRYESEEKFRLFCMAVQDLPPACRKAFLLKRVYGMSQSDVAAYMGISESTVEKHVSKGIVRCADFLRARGYSLSRQKPVVGNRKSK